MRNEQDFRAQAGADGRAAPDHRDVADPRAQAQARAMVGAVGDSIMVNADVSRARDRRREIRLRRLLALLCLVLAWMVFRLATGHGLFPSIPFPSSLDRWLPAFAIIVLLAVVMLAPLLGAGRSPHMLIRPGETEVGLDDVVGIDGIKAEVVRTVNLFLAHQMFRDSMGGSSRRGVLFEGPPGTGKTFVAKAMAKEAQVPFLFVSASAFQSMYFGADQPQDPHLLQTVAQVRPQGRWGHRLHRGDRRHRWGAPRAGNGHQRRHHRRGERAPGAVAVLRHPVAGPADGATHGSTSINHYLPNDRHIPKRAVVPANVLVVGATNRKDDLDPALLRPGRFDRSIYFGLPGRGARGDIVAYYLGKQGPRATSWTPRRPSTGSPA